MEQSILELKSCSIAIAATHLTADGIQGVLLLRSIGYKVCGCSFQCGLAEGLDKLVGVQNAANDFSVVCASRPNTCPLGTISQYAVGVTGIVGRQACQ